MDKIDKNTKYFDVSASFSINDFEKHIFRKGWILEKQTDNSLTYFNKKTKKQIEILSTGNENNCKSKILKSILSDMLYERNSKGPLLGFTIFFDYLVFICALCVSVLYLLFSTDYLQAIKGMFFAAACYYWIGSRLLY